MRNLKLKLMYNGKAYHGWQVQANADTVQGRLESAVEAVFGEHLTVYGCSRTDAGVHANEYFCNFRTEKSISCESVVKALNANLPDDIAVFACEEVREDFHSRFDCKSKRYVYKIWNSQIKNPFLTHTACHYKYRLDENLLNEAAQSFIGTYDFKAFCSAGSSVTDTVRTVKAASVVRQGDTVIFSVEADGFLYNMVRIMVGTLINVNEGKIDKNDIQYIIRSADRANAGVTAPAQGLFLDKVFY
ncbi:MAG: tRNA pseudouridine(38-40) synthase TruA [Clostridia bacterium]|nr:tRNA pseudouridine(38-40) synthase TruA [Clostridia bacterium]